MAESSRFSAYPTKVTNALQQSVQSAYDLSTVHVQLCRCAGPADGRVSARRGQHAWRDNQTLDLTPREFELLAYLVQHQGRVVSREMLAREVWKEPWRYTPLGASTLLFFHLRTQLDNLAIEDLETVEGLLSFAPDGRLLLRSDYHDHPETAQMDCASTRTPSSPSMKLLFGRIYGRQ